MDKKYKLINTKTNEVYGDNVVLDEKIVTELNYAYALNKSFNRWVIDSPHCVNLTKQTKCKD